MSAVVGMRGPISDEEFRRLGDDDVIKAVSPTKFNNGVPHLPHNKPFLATDTLLMAKPTING